MNSEGKPFKKSLKFLALLLTSILIASVSAAVYYSLSVTSTVTIAGTEVWLEAGADNGTACIVQLSPDKTVATITGLKAYPNATQTYEDPIDVHNNSTVSTYNVRLRHVSLTQTSTQFAYIKFTLSATAGSVTLTYTCDGSTWTPPSAPTTTVELGTSENAPIIIETKARDGATPGGQATIEIAVDVVQ